jgi:hypothetical protein
MKSAAHCGFIKIVIDTVITPCHNNHVAGMASYGNQRGLKMENKKLDKIANAQKAMLDGLRDYDNVNEETKILIEEVQALGGNAFIVSE